MTYIEWFQLLLTLLLVCIKIVECKSCYLVILILICTGYESYKRLSVVQMFMLGYSLLICDSLDSWRREFIFSSRGFKCMGVNWPCFVSNILLMTYASKTVLDSSLNFFLSLRSWFPPALKSYKTESHILRKTHYLPIFWVVRILPILKI